MNCLASDLINIVDEFKEFEEEIVTINEHEIDRF